jgi:hypothetical protein
MELEAEEEDEEAKEMEHNRETMSKDHLEEMILSHENPEIEISFEPIRGNFC